MPEQKTYYRRHLPHWQPQDATYHVVFRLAGSLPAKVIDELREEREQMEKLLVKTKQPDERRRLLKDIHWKIFEKYEALLDGNSTGPHWLREQAVAEIVKEAIHYRDGKEYDLLAYCIMPNHVHLVFTVRRNDIPSNNKEVLYRILQSLKRHTARQANLFLARSGAFWQDENYDHVIRDSVELERTIRYVLNNPVKAGLVKSWEEWKWTYVKAGLM